MKQNGVFLAPYNSIGAPEKCLKIRVQIIPQPWDPLILLSGTKQIIRLSFLPPLECVGSVYICNCCDDTRYRASRIDSAHCHPMIAQNTANNGHTGHLIVISAAPFINGAAGICSHHFFIYKQISLDK